MVNDKSRKMRKITLLLALFIMESALFGQSAFQKDTIPTQGGELIITFIGHGSLLFTWQDKQIYIDPVGQYADFSKMPKADAILVTHDHGDHLDAAVIESLSTVKTELYLTDLCQKKLLKGKIISNGGTFKAAGIPVEAVPAYNIISKRANGKPYHEKGDGNGYILTFSDVKLYVSGDTELIPEMKNIRDLDIAFLAVTEPYTMTVTMAVEAVKLLKPRIFYPYHLNRTNPEEIAQALKNSGIEVRIRKME
jgi:L-ascorbate metabolism protein UlaG (beta-lactamase superfamily)